MEISAGLVSEASIPIGFEPESDGSGLSLTCTGFDEEVLSKSPPVPWTTGNLTIPVGKFSKSKTDSGRSRFSCTTLSSLSWYSPFANLGRTHGSTELATEGLSVGAKVGTSDGNTKFEIEGFPLGAKEEPSESTAECLPLGSNEGTSVVIEESSSCR